MQNKFFIILLNGKISISSCESGEFSPLKKEGEEEQKYNKKEFWNWFKEKIEYENEELSFVVATDAKIFSIPKEIKLSKVNLFEKDSLCKNKIKKINSKSILLFFPAMKIEMEKVTKKIEEKKITEKIIKNSTKTTIAEIFYKQTEEYQNEKR